MNEARRPVANDDDSDRLLDGHIMAGAGLYIVKPFFQTNPAFTSMSAGFFNGNGSVTTTTAQQDFCWGLNAAPVIWLGYVSDGGWGVRARWWLFDQRSSTSVITGPNTTIFSAFPGGQSFPSILPAQMFVSSNLKLDSWDFEGTRETQLGLWGLLFSAGFRYAHLSQNYSAHSLSSINVVEAIRETQFLSSGHNFNGAGPTIALEAKRPIGSSGLSLFGSIRGVMLFGESKQQAARTSVFQLIPFGPAPNVFVSNFTSDHHPVLPVAELEMGVEFSRNWGNTRPFVRTGLLAQTWFDAGSASQLDGNLGFLGLSLTAGLNY